MGGGKQVEKRVEGRRAEKEGSRVDWQIECCVMVGMVGRGVLLDFVV